MKKYILFILLALSQVVFADYKPILEDGKTFSYIVLAMPDHHVAAIDNISLHETTTFNDKLYWVVGNHIIREDTENKKVYIIPQFAVGHTKEFLLYDFNVKPGDEIEVFQPLGWYEDENLYEDEVIPFLNESKAVIDEVKTDGERIQIEVNVGPESFNNHLTWVEGIGNKYTSLCNDMDIPYIVASRSNMLLLCVQKGDELIYRTGAGATYGCDGLNSALEEVPAEELLNISGNVLTLKRADVNAVSAIFSADGRQVMSFTGSTANISSLPQGLYVLRATAANGKNLTAKFVK